MLEDDWFAIDKLEHSLACALVVVTAYWVAARIEVLCPYRIIGSFFAGLAAGIIKEFGDFLHWWPGEASGKDLAADILGCLVPAAALVLWEHLSSRKELRYIDLELGVVYGNPIKRQWRKAVNSAKDVFAKAKENFP